MPRTTATSRPVNACRLRSMPVVSPRVADISRKVVSRQGDERQLPGDAALAVGVVVELVHHHVVGGRPGDAHRHVGQHLGGAAQDAGLAVDAGVAGHQADVLRPEGGAQIEELLVDQRLDRAAPEPGLALGQRLAQERGGHQRLARAGGRGEDQVFARQELEHRLLLGGVQLQPQAGDVLQEPPEDGVARQGRGFRRRQRAGAGSEWAAWTSRVGEPCSIMAVLPGVHPGSPSCRSPSRRPARPCSARSPRWPRPCAARNRCRWARRPGGCWRADVLADRDQPPFDRSTRDGFAVRAADVAGASPERPATVRRVGEVAAGAAFAGRVERRQLRRDHDRRAAAAGHGRGGDGRAHRTRRRRDPGAPRRWRPGRTSYPGAASSAPGRWPAPRAPRWIRRPSACWRRWVWPGPQVVARPRVAVLATGDELVPVEVTPAAAQIRDSNRHTLAAQIARAGGQPLPHAASCRDDPAAHPRGAGPGGGRGRPAAGQRRRLDGQVRLRRGGAGRSWGRGSVFDGVDIRPGKPLVFGVIELRRATHPVLRAARQPAVDAGHLRAVRAPGARTAAGAAPSAAPLATTGARLAADYAQRKLPLTVFVPARLRSLRRRGELDGAAGRGERRSRRRARATCVDGRRRRADDRRARDHASAGGVRGGRLAQMS